MPFAAFLFLFVFYLNVVYKQRLSDDVLVRAAWFPVDIGFMIVLGLFATYFLNNEVRQLKKDGFDYLSSIWNYIDIIPPIGILLMLLLNILSVVMDIN